MKPADVMIYGNQWEMRRALSQPSISLNI